MRLKQHRTPRKMTINSRICQVMQAREDRLEHIDWSELLIPETKPR